MAKNVDIQNAKYQEAVRLNPDYRMARANLERALAMLSNPR